MQSQEQQFLNLLLKAPKKKYLKKIIDYTLALNFNPFVCEYSMQTPVSLSFETDLQLSNKQSYELIKSLLKVIRKAMQLSFNEGALKKIFSSEFDEKLSTLIINTIVENKEDIEEYYRRNLTQGSQLHDINWKIELQVASQKGKSNTPFVIIDFRTIKDSKIETTKVNMPAEQFEVFVNNLSTIKQQLSSLIKQ